MKKYLGILTAVVLVSTPFLASAADSGPSSDTQKAATDDSKKSQDQLEAELDKARAQLQADANKVAQLSMQLNGSRMGRGFYFGWPRGGNRDRGYLGVDLSETDDNGADSGATISEVTPGSPADKAGLKAGDVINSVNSTSLKPSDDGGGVDKLMQVMDHVKPGDSVTLNYSRNGKAMTVAVTAGDARNVADVGVFGNSRRAVLGIDPGPGRGDAPGVAVQGVTPEGPADKAGLQAGDVITALNGTALKAEGDRSGRDVMQDVMEKVKPGDDVKVAYTRDGKAATATVKAGSPDDFFFSFRMPPIPPMPPMPAMPPMPRFGNFGFGFGFGDRADRDMQLVPLTADLGQYFGTDKGLLVVRAPRTSELQLKDGDVIVAIGGRDPGTPPHAMRIMSSYGPGESFKLDIMRKGKPVTLNVTFPKKSDDESTASVFPLLPSQGGDD